MEEEEEDKKKEKEEKEKGEEEYICVLLKKKKKKGDDVKTKLIKDVLEILEVIQKERSQVADIVCVISESDDGEKMKGNLAIMSLIQGNLRDPKESPGEWLYCKINEIEKYVLGTDFKLVPHMLKGIFVKSACYFMPQDLKREIRDEVLSETAKSCSSVVEGITGDGGDSGSLKELTPEEAKVRKAEVKLKAYIAEHMVVKQSKSGFPELGLPVTSKVVNRICIWLCPLEGCSKAFSGPQTCDAHINCHLGYEYGPCKTCGYTNASRDSYDKHKCFAGLKMGEKNLCLGDPVLKKGTQMKSWEESEEIESDMTCVYDQFQLC